MSRKKRSRSYNPLIRQKKIFFFIFEVQDLGFTFFRKNSGTGLPATAATRNKEQTLNEEISKLIDLQEIDSEIAGFNREIQDRQQEIADREQSIADKETAIEECLARTAELEQKKRDVTAEHEDAGARIKERQNKMMQVQTSREHQALLKEIEESKKLLKETEEQMLAIMEQIEEKTREAEELKNLCQGEKELLNQELDKVKKAIRKIESRRKSVTKKRDELAAELQGAILKRYNMLLSKRDGLAVVQAIDGVCQGCFMSIPPQQFNEVRKGSKMNLCPTCQRILYFKEEETVEA